MSDPFRGDTWLACSRDLQANQARAISGSQSAACTQHTRTPTNTTDQNDDRFKKDPNPHLRSGKLLAAFTQRIATRLDADTYKSRERASGDTKTSSHRIVLRRGHDGRKNQSRTPTRADHFEVVQHPPEDEEPNSPAPPKFIQRRVERNVIFLTHERYRRLCCTHSQFSY